MRSLSKFASDRNTHMKVTPSHPTDLSIAGSGAPAASPKRRGRRIFAAVGIAFVLAAICVGLPVIAVGVGIFVATSGVVYEILR